jgi:hypothetical protein
VISVRTKVLIGLAVLPVVLAVGLVIFVFVVPFFLAGLGIELPVFHLAGVIAVLAAWVIVAIGALFFFRRDKTRSARDS